ncbi:MAG TPA: IscS subfamily cysteine desulfurase [Chthonomonadaceae bacterium]|nr:IscS subfamily cysteine desulfurase [Chthonomonadaceae bacterium]
MNLPRNAVGVPDESYVYLDHAATTPVDPEVADAMLPYLCGPRLFGNPSSVHRFGREARAAVDEARDRVAKLVGADYSEVYFTGSGTEADNLALTGALYAAPTGRDHLVTSAIEHPAVLRTAQFLESRGTRITVLPVEPDGLLLPAAVEEALTDRTAIVSVMHANNEIGTIQPIAEIAAVARRRGALVHTDAVQTTGLLNIEFAALNVDMLTLSAHKIYGPKGVGALVIRSGAAVSPIVHGGAQEREKRAGTENVAAIVGFGKAAEITLDRRAADAARMTRLRDRFVAALVKRIPGIRINGSLVRRLPNNINVAVERVEGATLIMNLDRRGVAASSGSACSSGSIEPSHVLSAIGLPPALAASGIRFTLGRGTTEAEIDFAIAALAGIVERQRSRRE